MNNNQTVLDSIEPEIAERLTTSASEIAHGRTTSSMVGAGLAMASVPIALAALARDAGAQASSVNDILTFALKLEIFENEFYKAVLGTSSSTAQNNAFAAVRALIPAAALPIFQLIQKHEAAHVAFLTQAGAVNDLSLTADSFDFTGGRGSGTGPFAQATTNLQHLLLVTQAAEDTGVRAYKGQAPNILATGSLTTLESALRIHSVEARHAAKIRRLRRQNGAPTTVRYSGTVSGGDAAAAGASNVPNPPAAAVTVLGQVYVRENNTTQLTLDTSTLPNMPTSNFVAATAASEAFDEPLTRAEVISIVQGFFKPTLS
jgi:hypothetical protein